MLSQSRYDEVRRGIEAILDDTTLPRYLQVSRIIELFDPPGNLDAVDFWPDDEPAAREEKAKVTHDTPSAPKKAARKKRAKVAKRRTSAEKK